MRFSGHYLDKNEPKKSENVIYSLEVCRAKAVPSFLNNLKTLSICPAPGIETVLQSSTLLTQLILKRESTSRVFRCLLFLILNYNVHARKAKFRDVNVTLPPRLLTAPSLLPASFSSLSPNVFFAGELLCFISIGNVFAKNPLIMKLF